VDIKKERLKLARKHLEKIPVPKVVTGRWNTKSFVLNELVKCTKLSSSTLINALHQQADKPFASLKTVAILDYVFGFSENKPKGFKGKRI
jgi:hypothetical protein